VVGLFGYLGDLAEQSDQLCPPGSDHEEPATDEQQGNDHEHD